MNEGREDNRQIYNDALDDDHIPELEDTDIFSERTWAVNWEELHSLELNGTTQSLKLPYTDIHHDMD